MNRDDVIRMAREVGILETMGYGNPHMKAWQEDVVRELSHFAALVAAAAKAEEREAIMDEWWMCVQSDLENGVKSLNERAAKKWHKEYPAIAGFDSTIRARGETK